MPLAVLCLHRVLPERCRGGADEPYFRRHTAIEQGRFEGFLDALCARFEVMDPGRLHDYLGGDLAERSRPAVLLTFDDGYADVVEVALPALSRRGVRAVACVTTGIMAGEQAFPVDEWYGVVATATMQRGHLAGFGVEGWSFDLARGADMDRLIDGPEKRAYLRAGQRERAVLLEQLRQALGGRRGPAPRPLGAEGVRELARAGWVIGSHGRSHALLTRLKPDEGLAELIQSRDWLMGLGVPSPEIVAYPDGDTNPEVAHLAAQAGYRVGLALGGRLVSPADDRLLIPRLIVKNEDGWLDRRLLPLFAAADRDRCPGSLSG